MSGEPREVSRYLFVAAFGVWVPACGGKSETIRPPAAVHDDTSQLFASGTRLKAHYLDGGGGARKLLAFHDLLLDVECQFVETAAGRYACLPTASTRTFSDSACSAPSFPVASACPNAPVPVAGQLISAPSSDCTAQVAAYSLDALQDRTAQDPSYSLTVHGTCFSPTSQVAPPAQWTTKPEPLARFVQGMPSAVGAASGLQATRVTGDDGAFTTLELVTAGAVCTAITFGEVQRCVPQPFAQTFFYSYTDARCTDASVALVDATISERCAGMQPEYLVASTAAGCHVQSAIYALGDPLSQVFADTGSCAAIDLDGPGYTGDSFYRKGALGSAEVLPLVHSAQIGTGAVTALYYADSTDTPIHARGAPARSDAWALADGTQCTPLEDANGQLRCVHHALLVSSVDEYARCELHDTGVHRQPGLRIERGCVHRGERVRQLLVQAHADSRREGLFGAALLTSIWLLPKGSVLRPEPLFLSGRSRRRQHLPGHQPRRRSVSHGALGRCSALLHARTSRSSGKRRIFGSCRAHLA